MKPGPGEQALSTGIKRGAPAAPPTAAPRADAELASIVLAEAETARRAARWLRGANYPNLGVCLALFFIALEISDHAIPGVAPFVLASWFLLDFMPVALVFAGGHRLKRLKCLPLASAGAFAMAYLAFERLLLIAVLAPLHFEFPGTIPAPQIVWSCGIVLFLIDILTAIVVLRVLARPDFREAFR